MYLTVYNTLNKMSVYKNIMNECVLLPRNKNLPYSHYIVCFRTIVNMNSTFVKDMPFEATTDSDRCFYYPGVYYIHKKRPQLYSLGCQIQIQNNKKAVCICIPLLNRNDMRITKLNCFWTEKKSDTDQILADLKHISFMYKKKGEPFTRKYEWEHPYITKLRKFQIRYVQKLYDPKHCIGKKCIQQLKAQTNGL